MNYFAKRELGRQRVPKQELGNQDLKITTLLQRSQPVNKQLEQLGPEAPSAPVSLKGLGWEVVRARLGVPDVEQPPWAVRTQAGASALPVPRSSPQFLQKIHQNPHFSGTHIRVAGHFGLRVAAPGLGQGFLQFSGGQAAPNTVQPGGRGSSRAVYGMAGQTTQAPGQVRPGNLRRRGRGAGRHQGQGQ